jgi:hypothetical protein
VYWGQELGKYKKEKTGRNLQYSKDTMDFIQNMYRESGERGESNIKNGSLLEEKEEKTIIKVHLFQQYKNITFIHSKTKRGFRKNLGK